MRPLAILVTGEPVAGALSARGSFAAMIRAVVGDAWAGPWLEIDARGALPDFRAFAGLVITGSSANVPTREPWILEVEQYLARAVPSGLPIFGVCFGHQLLGQALGGRVEKNPRGREIGSVSLRLSSNDALFAEYPDGELVNMTHLDSVVELPPGARVLAATELEPYAALYFGQRAWGVQFHPEIDAEIIKHYVAARREILEAEGLDPRALEAGARDTPHSAALLRRFVAREVCDREFGAAPP